MPQGSRVSSSPVPDRPGGMASSDAPALLLLFAGIVAAIHIGKLPPALPVLKAELGVSLVEAGFLVAVTQTAGMLLGMVGGLIADRIGARRAVVIGHVVLAVGAVAAALAPDLSTLLVARAVESAGFLMAVVPAPALMRRCVGPARLNRMLGWWAAYMPAGMTIALVATPWAIAAGGWRGAWVACAALSLLAAWAVHRGVPDDPAPPATRTATTTLVAETMRDRGPWLVGLAFAGYAAQWVGVFSFLPTIYASAGIALTTAGALTAVAVAINVIGNVGGGWLLHHGWRPSTPIALASVTMATAAWVAFGTEAPFAVRYGAVLLFSAIGGSIPGVLFATAVRFAPAERTVSTTVGLMQQCSNLGQFVGPIAIAQLTAARGDWSGTWIVTGLFALGVLATAAAMAVYPPRPGR